LVAVVRARMGGFVGQYRDKKVVGVFVRFFQCTRFYLKQLGFNFCIM
jgi:hypothetical protein